MTPFEDAMKEAQEAEEKTANDKQKAVDKTLADRQKAHEAENERRAQEQVEAGDFPESQSENAFKNPMFTEADMSDEVREDKKEVDPQFAGKNAQEKAADLAADEGLSADEQDKVEQADQEVRAALTQKKSPFTIPDIPNAEGEDAEVVEGVEEAREAKNDD